MSGPDESTALGKLVSIGFVLMAVSPALLLVEAGATGYLGFKTRFRYVFLGLLILAVIAAVVGLAALFLVRLRQGAWQ